MKTILLFTTLIMLSSFTTAPTREDINSSSALGDRIVRSFQNQSADEFITLLPTLDEFHELMENNLEIYGSSLEEAKKDFSIEYNEHIVGAAKGSSSGRAARASKDAAG